MVPGEVTTSLISNEKKSGSTPAPTETAKTLSSTEKKQLDDLLRDMMQLDDIIDETSPKDAQTVKIYTVL